MRALMFMDDLLSIYQHIIFSLCTCTMFKYIVKYQLKLKINEIVIQSALGQKANLLLHSGPFQSPLNTSLNQIVS